MNANMNPKTSGTMGDKEIMTDMLSGQKFLTGAYNTFAGECQNETLRTDMLNILKEEHCIQSEIFTEMSSRGWYAPKAAPATEVSATLNKYSG